jgi:hypothetical protein
MVVTSSSNAISIPACAGRPDDRSCAPIAAPTAVQSWDWQNRPLWQNHYTGVNQVCPWRTCHPERIQELYLDQQILGMFCQPLLMTVEMSAIYSQQHAGLSSVATWALMFCKPRPPATCVSRNPPLLLMCIPRCLLSSLKTYTRHLMERETATDTGVPSNSDEDLWAPSPPPTEPRVLTWLGLRPISKLLLDPPRPVLSHTYQALRGSSCGEGFV